MYTFGSEKNLKESVWKVALKPSSNRNNEIGEGLAQAASKIKRSNPEMIAVQEYTNDDESKKASGSIKYDGGKSPIFRGALSYFPRAISEVASVSAFGASKYAWKGWEGVDNGYERYSDGMVRHLAAEGKGEVLDPDSGLLHAAHTAWNALARLELYLKEQENAGPRETKAA